LPPETTFLDRDLMIVAINDLEQAAVDLVNADTRFTGLGYYAETNFKKYGAFGTVAFGIGSVASALDLAGVGHNPYETQEEVHDRMQGVVGDLDERLADGVSEIIICTKVSNTGEDACTESIVFELETGRDVVELAEATLSHNELADFHQTEELLRAERVAFEGVLGNIEAPPDRTEEFDMNVILAMQTATDSYVAQVPRDPKPEVGTSDIVVAGGLMISIAAIVAGVVMRRTRVRNINNAIEARLNLENKYDIAKERSRFALKVHHAASSSTHTHLPNSKRKLSHSTPYHHSGILNGKRRERLRNVREAASLARNELQPTIR
jgi:hypothetical protein